VNRSSPLYLAAFAAAIGSFPANPALAQQRALTLTPSVGVFFAGTDLVDAGDIVDSGSRAETITVQQQVGPTVGLRGSYRLSGRLGIEAEMALAFSEVELSFATPDRASVTQDATVFALGVGLSYEVLRLPFAPFAAHVLGGVGLTARGGEFFDDGGGALVDVSGGSDFAVFVGSGFRYGIDPKVSLRVDARDYISAYGLQVADTELDSELQHEVWVSLGLEFGL